MKEFKIKFHANIKCHIDISKIVKIFFKFFYNIYAQDFLIVFTFLNRAVIIYHYF